MKHVGEERAWYSPPYELEGENCWVQPICGLGQIGPIEPKSLIEGRKQEEGFGAVRVGNEYVRRRAEKREERNRERK